MSRSFFVYRRHCFACWKRFLAVFLFFVVISHLFLSVWKSDFSINELDSNSVQIRSLKNRPTTEVPSIEKEKDIDELVAHLHRKSIEVPVNVNESVSRIMAFKPMDIDSEYLEKLRNDPVFLKNWFEKKEKEYNRRTKRIKDVCRRYNIDVAPPFTNVTYLPRVLRPDFEDEPPTERIDRDHFSLAPSYQAMSCFVNKVASSSLATAFLSVAGFGPEFTSPHSMLGLIKPRSDQDFVFSNSTFFKFMFVRHPFDRLLSCYRDKMVTSPHWSLPAFRRHIRTTARQVIAARDLLAEGLPYPPIEEKLSQKKTPSSKKGNRKRRRSLLAVEEDDSKAGEVDPAMLDDTPPTFEEFLEYILATDLQGHGYDSHWVPYWRHCTPCHVPYKIIGKLETAQDDFTYVWKKTGLDSTIPIPFVNGKKKLDNERSLDLQTQYYTSLPRELILRTFQRFRLDFEMFEYSINEVLRKGGHALLTEYEALSP